MVNPHTSAPAPYFTPDAMLAEVDTEQLASMVRRLDRDVREARRAIRRCAVIEDVAYFAARCRIELRRRQAADHLADAQWLLSRVGGEYR